MQTLQMPICKSAKNVVSDKTYVYTMFWDRRRTNISIDNYIIYFYILFFKKFFVEKLVGLSKGSECNAQVVVQEFIVFLFNVRAVNSYKFAMPRIKRRFVFLYVWWMKCVIWYGNKI